MQHPKTVDQLKQSIQDIWESFYPDFLRPFCCSKPRRIKLCLKNKGKKIIRVSSSQFRI